MYRRFFVIFFSCFFAISFFSRAQNNFTPPDISGLTLWLIGDSVSHNGGFIDTAYDCSGNANHAIQNVLADKPASVFTNINGHKTIRFDGVSDHLVLLSSLDIRTVFYVFKYSGGTISIGYPTLIGSSDNPPKYVSIIENNSTSFRVTGETYCTDYYINTIHTNNLAPLTGDKICYGTRSANQQLSNVQIASSYAFHPFAAFWGDIAEIIIYNTPLTTTERQQVEQYLNDKYAPPVNLGADIIIPYGFCDTTLTVNAYYTNYLWSTGATSQSIQVNQSGTYWVQATNIFGFVSSDTITVTYPDYTYTGATNICANTSSIWNTNLSINDYTFLWQDNSTNNQYNITNAGTYQVTVTDSFGCSSTSPVVAITVDNYPNAISLGNDTTFCLGGSIALITGQQQTSIYLWSTGATTASIIPSSSGTYWVRGTNNNGCIASDTIIVNLSGIAATPLFNASSLCEGDSVQFSDLSVPPNGDFITNWNWNFGDMTNSALQNPKHLFADSGFYNVSLSVTTNVGCVSQVIQQIHVFPKPLVAFTSQNRCENESTLFINGTSFLGYQGSSYNWNFGDPSTGPLNTSVLTNPLHDFSSANTFQVKLIAVSTNGCIDSVTQNVVINQPPNAGFTNTLACLGQDVFFTDTSTINLPFTITSQNWDFGNGDFSSLAFDSTHYMVNGGHLVTLIVLASNGCKDTVTKPIIVFDTPTAHFVTNQLCVSDTVFFTDSSTVFNSTISAWNWTFQSTGNSTQQNPFVIFSTANTYAVSLTVMASNGCTDSINRQITVNPKPNTSFTFSPTGGGVPLIVDFTNTTTDGQTYSWNFGDNSTSSLFNPTHTYTTPANTNIYLESTNSFGCKSSFTQPIQILSRLVNIVITDIHTSLNNGFLTVSADMLNLSTINVYDLDMILNVNDLGLIREQFADTFLRFAQITYTFNAQPFIPNEGHYVCVNVQIPTPDIDIEPVNNNFCKAIKIESFLVGDIVPNPANQNISIPVMLPFDDNLVVEIYDLTGKIISTVYSGYANKGLFLLNVNVEAYSKGMYAVVVKFRDRQQVKKFIKN